MAAQVSKGQVAAPVSSRGACPGLLGFPKKERKTWVNTCLAFPHLPLRTCPLHQPLTKWLGSARPPARPGCGGLPGAGACARARAMQCSSNQGSPSDLWERGRSRCREPSRRSSRSRSRRRSRLSPLRSSTRRARIVAVSRAAAYRGAGHRLERCCRVPADQGMRPGQPGRYSQRCAWSSRGATQGPTPTPTPAPPAGRPAAVPVLVRPLPPPLAAPAALATRLPARAATAAPPPLWLLLLVAVLVGRGAAAAAGRRRF